MRLRHPYEEAQALVLARMTQSRAVLLADARRLRPVRRADRPGQWAIERELSTLLSSPEAKLLAGAFAGAFVLGRHRGLAAIFRSAIVTWIVRWMRAVALR
ncbi:hypothetical protein [Paraburkholderia caballeronis]|uniref:YqjK-like protein n=1 Tax=Paraburkholderia caballeronis TaxID=416943 RepID=A0A1H7LSN2_9BURK|nr:hypothetical protein [Paraburkholderia caballeronis]PXW28585.1 hypothetical protein C7403_102479 [Paraburkholderia caballeronis]PXX03951.1 hypothetical protein C7407_102479 [Paraburkholderia caballeronis]RAK04695.1 hypothetical protein C7409_102479 [Paraburkholderia caballeronis]SED69252.1 hypothetical protein SAMN05445871_3697 [Paraburkholderia caballeronis]SEL01932.1 hypothetical protein SAMN05192542_104480 [Paraburkholderia caballeronis]